MVVFCTYCGRAFSRNEHLERHVLTHTKVRPYRCTICHASFTRLDLLQKHYRSHSVEEIATVQNLVDPPMLEGRGDVTPAVRPRKMMACNNCAKSKVSCDHEHPCGRCKARGLVCESRTSKRARGSFSVLAVDHPRSVKTHKTSDGHPVPDGATGAEHINSLFEGSQRLNDQETSDIFREPRSFDVDDSLRIPGSANSDSTESVISRAVLLEGVTNDNDNRCLNGDFESNKEVLRLPTEPVSNQLLPVSVDPPENRAPDFNQQILDAGNWTTNGFSQTYSYSPVTLSMSSDIFSVSTHYPNSGIPSAPVGDVVTSYDPSDLLDDNSVPDGNNMDKAHEASFFALDLTFDQYPQRMINSMSFKPVDMPTVDEIGSKSRGLLGFSPRFGDTGLEQWNLCRCIPYSTTAATLADFSDTFDLDTSCSDLSSWSKSAHQFRQQTFQTFEHISLATLTETTREWMLVVIQSFLRLTLESRGLKIIAHSPREKHPPEFIFLPPNNSLHRYLEIFLTTYDPFYPMVPAMSLNPNKLATSSNERGATLLLLLMVALGSMLDPSMKARRFSFALSEICRHSLGDILTEDILSYQSSLNLQCAFLFVIGAAFSGRKMHMDMAVPWIIFDLIKSGMQMMRHGQLFQPRSPLSTLLSSFLHLNGSVDSIWKAWIDRETASRLACCWVIADQEISLFYDSPPCLALSDLDIPLPCNEELWLAPSAAQWEALVCGIAPGPAETIDTFLQRPQLSLQRLFLQVTESRSSVAGCDLQPFHLRLLLYPLQIMVSHLRQSYSLLSSDPMSSNIPAFTFQSSLTLRFGELHRLLSRWFDLFEEVQVQGMRSTALMQSTAVLYHLIHLNLLTSFQDLESFARGDHLNSNSDIVGTIREGWFQEPEDVLVHCGQVLHLIHGIDKKLRPNWWAAAIYRITIIMWTWGITQRPCMNQLGIPGPTPTVVLNSPSWRDANITSYLRNHRGKPCLKTKSGVLISITDSKAIMSECIEALEAGPKMCRFTEGILHRIEAVAKAWEGFRE